MSFELRHSEPDDAEAIHAILTSPHVVTGSMRLPFMHIKTTQDRLAYDANRLQVVALHEGEVVGFSELILNSDTPRASHSAEINMVATRADLQGNGVARALVKELIKICEECFGIKRLSLIVWAHNTRARELYASFGFEEEGYFRDFVRNDVGYGDAVPMAKFFEPR